MSPAQPVAASRYRDGPRCFGPTMPPTTRSPLAMPPDARSPYAAAAAHLRSSSAP